MRPRNWPGTELHQETQRRAYRKLAVLNRAATLDDLRVATGSNN
jgi:hypothetical protein